MIKNMVYKELGKAPILFLTYSLTHCNIIISMSEWSHIWFFGPNIQTGITSKLFHFWPISQKLPPVLSLYPSLTDRFAMQDSHQLVKPNQTKPINTKLESYLTSARKLGRSASREWALLPKSVGPINFSLNWETNTLSENTLQENRKRSWLWISTFPDQTKPNFTIFTKFYNLNQISQSQLDFTISTKFHNLN